MDRALVYETKGHGFESRQARKRKPRDMRGFSIVPGEDAGTIPYVSRWNQRIFSRGMLLTSGAGLSAWVTL